MSAAFQIELTVEHTSQTLPIPFSSNGSLGDFRKKVAQLLDVNPQDLSLSCEGRDLSDSQRIGSISNKRPLQLKATLKNQPNKTSLLDPPVSPQPSGNPTLDVTPAQPKSKDTSSKTDDVTIDHIPIGQPIVRPTKMEPETYIAYIRSDPVASNLLQQSRPDIYQAVQIGDTDVVDLYLMEVYNHKMKVYHKLQQRQRMIDANPNSVEAQTAIMANIHRIAIKENFEKAMEEIPESFVSVHMLYIPVEINGRPVQVFVDSGAQITVISRTLCDHCGIGHLIDKSVKGRAVGVGTAESVGRIHAVPLKIGTKLYTTSFMVLEGGPVDCLLGLDMLRRHRCVIDLDQNVIRIGGESLPFLTEQQTKTSMLDEKTPLGYTPDPPVAQKKSAPINLIPQLTYSEQNLQSLLDMGVDRDRAIQALTAANDNLDAAIDLI